MDFETVGSDGHRFRISDQGEGPAVVLLHGFPDTPMSWATTADLLVKAGNRVIVAYLRGYHPDTVVEGRSYGPDETGADVIDLLDHLGLDRCVVVGHDYGASCVWSAADQAPGRFDALVPIAIPHTSTVQPTPRLAWEARHFIDFKLPGSDRRFERDGFAYIDRLYHRWAPDWTGEEQAATVTAAKEAMALPGVAHEALNWYRDLPLKPGGSASPPDGVPVLMVAGAADFTGMAEAAQATVDRSAPTSSLLLVDGAGHWPHREDADAFHQALVEFLADLDRTPWSEQG